MKKNKQSGFTLIELLVVIAIIGILASIVLASLSTARSKGNDAKIESEVNNMESQAQLWTPSGTVAQVGPGVAVIPSPAANPIGSGVNLFTDPTGSNSLSNLIANLPSGTNIYAYTQSITPPSAGGQWFVAAGTSTGAFCVDWKGGTKTYTGTTPTSVATFTAAFPNATVAGGASCN